MPGSVRRLPCGRCFCATKAEQFEDISDHAGEWFERSILGRGLAVGDLDGDGRPDVVINALDAPAAVLRNTSDGATFFPSMWSIAGVGRPWALRVRLEGGGRDQVGLVTAGGSYLSFSPGRLHFGLGSGEPSTESR